MKKTRYYRQLKKRTGSRGPSEWLGPQLEWSSLTNEIGIRNLSK